MKELNDFESIHGKYLLVGMKVKVCSSNEYANEWQGEFLVTGINWNNHQQKINVTISEELNDGGTDGWSPEDLIPATCCGH